jgi:hypothetical protein
VKKPPMPGTEMAGLVIFVQLGNQFIQLRVAHIQALDQVDDVLGDIMGVVPDAFQ